MFAVAVSSNLRRRREREGKRTEKENDGEIERESELICSSIIRSCLPFHIHPVALSLRSVSLVS